MARITPSPDNNQSSARTAGRFANRVNHRGKQGHCLRKHVLALRNLQPGIHANEFSIRLQEALLQLETQDEPVDSGLIGMAAAQAARLGLDDLVGALVAYSWPRLSAFSGREVAELASAAAKCCIEDIKLFTFISAYCNDNADAFNNLRDVALLASALMKNSSSNSSIFIQGLCGLCKAVVLILAGLPSDVTVPPRDASDFLSCLAKGLEKEDHCDTKSLLNSSWVSETILKLVTSAKFLLHRASAQDIAKFVGSISIFWVQFPLLRQTFRPVLQDLGQGFRFRNLEFNPQDVCSLAVGYSKSDELDELLLGVLGESISGHLLSFSSKDLSLLLTACARSPKIEATCSQEVICELARRNMSDFSVQDLCMSVQCLARLGQKGKPTLCLIADQIFRRRCSGLTASDKVYLLWSLAKSGVVHLALRRMLVRDLATDDANRLSRDVASIALWSMAVFQATLCTADRDWTHQLISNLIKVEPWVSAAAFEVTNAAWAFSRLPEELLNTAWPSLVSSINSLQLSSLSLHELNNLLSGLVSIGEADDGVFALIRKLAEVMNERLSCGEQFSMHDKQMLLQTLQKGTGRSELKLLCERFPASSGASSQHEDHNSEDKPSCQSSHTHHEKSCSGYSSDGFTDESDADDVNKQTCQAADHRDDDAKADHVTGEEASPTVHSCSNRSVLQGLRINSHCNYKGHCVQLKHTFIHIECTNTESDDECLLCGVAHRPRSKSLERGSKIA